MKPNCPNSAGIRLQNAANASVLGIQFTASASKLRTVRTLPGMAIRMSAFRASFLLSSGEVWLREALSSSTVGAWAQSSLPIALSGGAPALTASCADANPFWSLALFTSSIVFWCLRTSPAIALPTHNPANTPRANVVIHRTGFSYAFKTPRTRHPPVQQHEPIDIFISTILPFPPFKYQWKLT